MNEEQQKQRKRQRLLLPVSVLIILLFLIVGLVLAYQVAQERLMPGGPTLVYRVDPAKRTVVLPLVRERVNTPKAIVRPGAEPDIIEVLLPPVSKVGVGRVRMRIETPAEFTVSAVAPGMTSAQGAGVRHPASDLATVSWGVAKDAAESETGVRLNLRLKEGVSLLDGDPPSDIVLVKFGDLTYQAKHHATDATQNVIIVAFGMTDSMAEDLETVLNAKPYPSPLTFVKLIPATTEDGETHVPTTTEEADSSNGQ